MNVRVHGSCCSGRWKHCQLLLSVKEVQPSQMILHCVPFCVPFACVYFIIYSALRCNFVLLMSIPPTFVIKLLRLLILHKNALRELLQLLVTSRVEPFSVLCCFRRFAGVSSALLPNACADDCTLSAGSSKQTTRWRYQKEMREL